MLARYPCSPRTRQGAAKCLLYLRSKSTIRYISESATQCTTGRTYSTNVVSDRFRMSKNVRKMAIRISTAAAKTRHKTTRICPPGCEVFSSDHKAYPYHRCIVINRSVWNNLYAGKETGNVHEQIAVRKNKTNEPIRIIQYFYDQD